MILMMLFSIADSLHPQIHPSIPSNPIPLEAGLLLTMATWPQAGLGRLEVGAASRLWARTRPRAEPKMKKSDTSNQWSNLLSPRSMIPSQPP